MGGRATPLQQHRRAAAAAAAEKAQQTLRLPAAGHWDCITSAQARTFRRSASTPRPRGSAGRRAGMQGWLGKVSSQVIAPGRQLGQVGHPCMHRQASTVIVDATGPAAARRCTGLCSLICRVGMMALCSGVPPNSCHAAGWSCAAPTPVVCCTASPAHRSHSLKAGNEEEDTT